MQTATAEREIPLTVPQVAKRLGLAPNSVYSLVDAGKLRAFNVGAGQRRRIKIFWRDVEAYLAGVEIKPSNGNNKRRSRAATSKRVERIV